MTPRSPHIDNREKRGRQTFTNHVTGSGSGSDAPVPKTKEKDSTERDDQSTEDVQEIETSDEDSTSSLLVTSSDQAFQQLRRFRSTAPRQRLRVQKKTTKKTTSNVLLQQTTRNVRSLETDVITAVHVDEYDYSSRMYTVGLTMAHEDGARLCRVKLSWTRHVQHAFSKVKREAPKDAFNQFMQDVNRTFSFAPKYKSFKQFLVGRMNSRNHRSVLLVGTVLTYIVNQAQQHRNANFRVCLLLLEKIFGIMN
jgi:hypothetical protein